MLIMVFPYAVSNLLMAYFLPALNSRTLRVSLAFCSAVVVINVMLSDNAIITAMPSVISIYMCFLSLGGKTPYGKK